MATNVDVTKQNNENSISLIRRFSRKMRATNVLREVRNRRFFNRTASNLRRKQGALARIETGKRYDKLRKLGKIT